MYQRKVITYQPVDLQPGELMRITEAAAALGVGKTGVISMLERGKLTEIVDQGAAYHDRRRVVRAEVLRLAAERNYGDAAQ